MYVIIEVIILLLRLLYYNVEVLYRVFFPPSPKSVRGQVVLVTGGAKGIGRSLAFKFAGLGAKVAIWDVDKQGNEDTVQSINSLGGTSRAYHCDVTSVESVRKAAQQVRRELGEVNILVNNAGIMNVKKILDLSETEIRKTMEINTMAHFWTVREFLPKMIEKKQGHIVTIASMAGIKGVPLLTDYCASKFGAVGFSLSLQDELRVDKVKGINFTIVCPMFANTNLINTHGNRIVTHNRFGKMLSTEEVADPVVNGVLRNKEIVYIPSRMATTPMVLPFLPTKSNAAIMDFLDSGFSYAKK